MEHFQHEGFGTYQLLFEINIEIKQDVKRGSIEISRWKDGEEVLTHLGMENCKPSLTPMYGNFKLQKPNSNVPVRVNEARYNLWS